MSVQNSEAQRDSVQSPTLTDHYRAIGPAAILAAVLAVKTKQPKIFPAAVAKRA